jgi:hypothetical protein
MIFRGGEFSTGEMGNFHPPLTQRRRRWFGTCPCRPVPVGIEPRRVHLVIKTKSHFLGPPCNPGKSDFPIPVLALAFSERPFRDG